MLSTADGQQRLSGGWRHDGTHIAGALAFTPGTQHVVLGDPPVAMAVPGGVLLVTDLVLHHLHGHRSQEGAYGDSTYPSTQPAQSWV